MYSADLRILKKSLVNVRFDSSGKPPGFYPTSLPNLDFILEALSRDISVSFRATTMVNIKL